MRINIPQNTTNKKYLLYIAAVLIFSLILLPSVFAQDYTDIAVSLEVDQGQTAELTLDGCWAESTPGNDDWAWRGTAISLKQPGDREIGTGDDQYNIYTVSGGSPNGDVLPINGNAFAYGDCKFSTTVLNYSDYSLQFYTDGPFDDGLSHEIPDMYNYDNSAFDFNLNSEASGYNTGTNYGEHGFFIVSTDIDTADISTDSTYDGNPTYTYPKKYNEKTCNPSNPPGSRPCYHQYTTTGVYPKEIIDGATAGDQIGKYFVIRTAFGADFSFPAGTYSMTITASLNTNP